VRIRIWGIPIRNGSGKTLVISDVDKTNLHQDPKKVAQKPLKCFSKFALLHSGVDDSAVNLTAESLTLL
jgi:hypothetical protein